MILVAKMITYGSLCFKTEQKWKPCAGKPAYLGTRYDGFSPRFPTLDPQERKIERKVIVGYHETIRGRKPAESKTYLNGKNRLQKHGELKITQNKH